MSLGVPLRTLSLLICAASNALSAMASYEICRGLWLASSYSFPRFFAAVLLNYCEELTDCLRFTSLEILTAGPQIHSVNGGVDDALLRNLRPSGSKFDDAFQVFLKCHAFLLEVTEITGCDLVRVHSPEIVRDFYPKLTLGL